MRLFASAAFVTAASLAAASASAADPAPAPAAPATAPAPAPIAPPLAAPPPVAAPPAYGPVYPGYPVPYAFYGAPGGAMAPAWMAPPPVTERRSNAMRITGIALFATGGVISGVGVAILGLIGTHGCVDEGGDFPTRGGSPPSGADAVHERVGSARQALSPCDTSPDLPLGLVIAGFATAVAGIPLYVLGTQQVPVRPQSQSRNLVPTLGLGSHEASLRWTF